MFHIRSRGLYSLTFYFVRFLLLNLPWSPIFLLILFSAQFDNYCLFIDAQGYHICPKPNTNAEGVIKLNRNKVKLNIDMK